MGSIFVLRGSSGRGHHHHHAASFCAQCSRPHPGPDFDFFWDQIWEALRRHSSEQYSKEEESLRISGEPIETLEYEELEPEKIPRDFLCPIKLQIMEDPVVASDGHSYEAKSLQELFLKRQGPFTSPLARTELMPYAFRNNTLKKCIQDWAKTHPKAVKIL